MATKMATMNAKINSGNNEAHERHSSINAFFAGTVIFLTGATGFLGKALLEKLLRSCPVSKIFILIRSKNNKPIEQRFKKLLNNNVFDRIRSEFPGILEEKIFPVEGDVSLPELGLQSKDRDMLLQTVNIVYHSAATVRFNEPLKIAVNLNVMGTDHMLDLCRRMKNLISIIHVSTAYSNADRREIEESIYVTEVKPHTMIDMCENLNDETFGMIEKILIGKYPNTYTLTKNLAEQIVMEKGKNLPIAIVRPSIICAANQEPFPGWIDNINGITGIIMEIGRGTVRSILCDAKLRVDIVPVDFVVNTLICASWYNFVQRTDTIKIYNCISSTMHPITWGEIEYFLRKYVIETPSKCTMWYPGFTLTTNQFMHAINRALLHFLPAYIIDLILRARGCKSIMLKVTKRIDRTAKICEFFSINEWAWNENNMKILMNYISRQENNRKFDIDIRNINWDTYLHKYVIGIRTYILRDDLDTLNNARSRLKKLYWIHQCTKIFGIAALLGSIIYIQTLLQQIVI